MESWKYCYLSQVRYLYWFRSWGKYLSKRIEVFSRLGLVPVGEASVVIAISSTHRLESLEAVHHAIDSLKKSVPIWKKEIYDEGAEEWKTNNECPWAESKYS